MVRNAENNKKQSLANINPELAKEWNYEANAIEHDRNSQHPAKPEDVTPGSGVKVWWLYPYDDPETGKHFDFTWKTQVKTRNRGAGCPYLSGHAVWPGFNDLATKRPDLVKEWDYKKNKELHDKDVASGKKNPHPASPKDVTPSSRIKAHWLLPYDDPETGKHFDFEWEATIADRNVGNGCPYLNGTEVWQGFNDLVTKNPQLAKEWDYEANAIEHAKNQRHPTRPEYITSGSTMNVYWKIKNVNPETRNKIPYFKWRATVKNRNRGHKCPFTTVVAKKVLVGFNDLATTNPELASEWDYEANAEAHKKNPSHPLSPKHITSGSQVKAYWKIKNLDNLTRSCFPWLKWDAVIKDRVGGHGCPYISNPPRKVLVGFNDLATKNPELASEWDYEANAKEHAKNKRHPLTPRDVTSGSHTKVFWVIKNNNPATCAQSPYFKWSASIKERNNGIGCPFINLYRGEELIKNICIDSNYIFSTQAKYLDLIDEKCLSFDFHIATHTKHGVLIEYDGIQHFEPNEYYGLKSFQSGVKHDNMKNQYAQDKNISLLRIPYIYDPVKDKEKIKNFVCNFVKTQIIPSEILDFYKNIKHSNYYDCMIKLQAKRNVNNLIKINEIAI